MLLERQLTLGRPLMSCEMYVDEIDAHTAAGTEVAAKQATLASYMIDRGPLLLSVRPSSLTFLCPFLLLFL